MFNVVISKEVSDNFRKKGYFFRYHKKRMVIRNIFDEPLIELIWNEEGSNIIVLTRTTMIYADSVMIRTTKAMDPEIFLTTRKGIGRIITVKSGNGYEVK